jgi:hypothetical protein
MWTNLKNHLKMQAERMLSLFVKGMIILHLRPEHYGGDPSTGDHNQQPRPRQRASKNVISYFWFLMDHEKKKKPVVLKEKYDYLKPVISQLVPRVHDLRKRLNGSYSKKSIRYHDLLSLVFYMLRELETTNVNNRSIPLINLLPLADTSPICIPLDSTALRALLNTFFSQHRLPSLGQAKNAKKKQKGPNGVAVASMTRAEYNKAVFQPIFNVDKIIARRPDAQFNYYLQTDGVCIALYYRVIKPIRQSEAKEQPIPITGLRRGLFHEHELTASRQDLRQRTLLSIDPGERSIITAINLRDCLKTYSLPPQIYQRHAGVEYGRRYREKPANKTLLQLFSQVMAQTPFSRSVSVDRFLRWCRQLETIWRAKWDWASVRRVREVHFHAFIKRQQFSAKVANCILDLGSNAHMNVDPIPTASAITISPSSNTAMNVDPSAVTSSSSSNNNSQVPSATITLTSASAMATSTTATTTTTTTTATSPSSSTRDYRNDNAMPPLIFFGAGSENGLFLRHRNGIFKGPTERLKRELAKRCVVVVSNEYRTSKLCLDCGWCNRHLVNKHGKLYPGVSFCSRFFSHSHWNRDTLGALTIGYRSVATLLGYDLGPFSASAPKTDEPWSPDKPSQWPHGPSMRSLYRFRRLSRQEQILRGGSTASRRIVVDCLI